MKKILALVLALVMTLALAACGNTDAKPNDTGADGEAAGWTPSANITVIVPIRRAAPLTCLSAV